MGKAEYIRNYRVLAAAYARLPHGMASEVVHEALRHALEPGEVALAGGPSPQQFTDDASGSLLLRHLVIDEGWPLGAAVEVFHAYCAVTGAK